MSLLLTAAEARGFPASSMARKMAGDYRNKDQIRQWATGVAMELDRLLVSRP